MRQSRGRGPGLPPRSYSLRVRRPLLPIAIILPLFLPACSTEREADTKARRSESAAASRPHVAGRECVRGWDGPWTYECSAQWVRQVVRAAGYRMTGDTGSAWVAAGGGRSFYIWATEATSSPKQIAKREHYRLVRRVAKAPVYDDGVRKFWPARGFIFWVEAGPRKDSIAPTARELEPLIRASRRLRPPTTTS